MTPTQEPKCPFCGHSPYHYMQHVCRGCECHFREVGIPGEPQLGTHLEGEWEPTCPIHTPEAMNHA